MFDAVALYRPKLSQTTVAPPPALAAACPAGTDFPCPTTILGVAIAKTPVAPVQRDWLFTWVEPLNVRPPSDDVMTWIEFGFHTWPLGTKASPVGVFSFVLQPIQMFPA